MQRLGRELSLANHLGHGLHGGQANAGDDHIVVARARDYFDIAPVKGVMRSAGEQSSTQAVDVVPLT